MSSPLEALETNLEMFIENVRQLGIIVSDFQPQGQTTLNQKINHIVTLMQEVDKCKPQVQDIQVPLEVFDYIDQGRNPQLFTKDCMEKALAKNEQVKGKIESYRRFKALLLLELSKLSFRTFATSVSLENLGLSLLPSTALQRGTVAERSQMMRNARAAGGTLRSAGNSAVPERGLSTLQRARAQAQENIFNATKAAPRGPSAAGRARSNRPTAVGRSDPVNKENMMSQAGPIARKAGSIKSSSSKDSLDSNGQSREQRKARPGEWCLTQAQCLEACPHL
ncbi:mediator of RNA polymerase II transcription subunit 10 [Ixodes scapularis]